MNYDLPEINIDDFDKIEITGLFTTGQISEQARAIQDKIDQDLNAKYRSEKSASIYQRREYNGRTTVR